VAEPLGWRRGPQSAGPVLVLENAADFGAITIATAVSARDAEFTTDQAPVIGAGFRANNFPFFQASNEIDDGDNGEVFAEGAVAFTESIEGVDEEANIETQVSVGKFEAYYRDDLEGEVTLHKLQVQVHPMGFICGWDEALIPFVDGTTAREQSAFQGIDNPPLTASFFQPNLVRKNDDGIDVTYQCSCFSRTCRSNAGECLDATDPDAPASAEACNP
jgi:hypothetical protein